MRTALLISGMLAGCAGGGPDQPEVKPSPAAPAPPSGDRAPWVPDQGTHILGANADGLAAGAAYLSVSKTPAYRTMFTLSLSRAADGAHLSATDGTTTYSKDDPWFDGLIMTASDAGQIKILSSAPIVASDVGYNEDGTLAETEYVANAVASTEYTLRYRKAKPGGGYEDWQDYCEDGGAAVPVAGHYNAQRDHRSGGISFACHTGIAFKCTMWGYPTGSGSDPDAWNLHSACTGMGNARYCGDAHSFTREQTPIWIVDRNIGRGIDNNASALTHPGKNGDRWPGNPDTFYIEAGWTASGTPICLSRLRWVSLPPNPCPGVLKDPRVVPHAHNDSEVFFCDDLEVDQLFTRGAVLINGSMMMDAPVGRWRDADGHTVSTIRGVQVDTDASETVYPPFFDGNGDPIYTTFLGYDGMLLRNLTATLDEAKDMKLLYMQNLGAPADHYLSDTSAGGGGRSDPSFEAYSFQQAQTYDSENEEIDAVPFNQCQWSRKDGPDLDTDLDGAARRCVVSKPLGFALRAP